MSEFPNATAKSSRHRKAEAHRLTGKGGDMTRLRQHPKSYLVQLIGCLRAAGVAILLFACRRLPWRRMSPQPCRCGP